MSEYVPTYPRCTACGSVFCQLEGDDYAECPACRPDEPTYGERLSLGFKMIDPDNDEGTEL